MIDRFLDIGMITAMLRNCGRARVKHKAAQQLLLDDPQITYNDKPHRIKCKGVGAGVYELFLVECN